MIETKEPQVEFRPDLSLVERPKQVFLWARVQSLVNFYELFHDWTKKSLPKIDLSALGIELGIEDELDYAQPIDVAFMKKTGLPSYAASIRLRSFERARAALASRFQLEQGENGSLHIKAKNGDEGGQPESDLDCLLAPSQNASWRLVCGDKLAVQALSPYLTRTTPNLPTSNDIHAEWYGEAAHDFARGIKGLGKQMTGLSDQNWSLLEDTLGDIEGIKLDFSVGDLYARLYLDAGFSSAKSDLTQGLLGKGQYGPPVNINRELWNSLPYEIDMALAGSGLSLGANGGKRVEKVIDGGHLPAEFGKHLDKPFVAAHGVDENYLKMLVSELKGAKAHSKDGSELIDEAWRALEGYRLLHLDISISEFEATLKEAVEIQKKGRKRYNEWAKIKKWDHLTEVYMHYNLTTKDEFGLDKGSLQAILSFKEFKSDKKKKWKEVTSNGFDKRSVSLLASPDRSLGGIWVLSSNVETHSHFAEAKLGAVARHSAKTIKERAGFEAFSTQTLRAFAFASAASLIVLGETNKHWGQGAKDMRDAGSEIEGILGKIFDPSSLFPVSLSLSAKPVEGVAKEGRLMMELVLPRKVVSKVMELQP